MRQIVLGVLYLVVAASCVYAALGVYALIDLWDAKLQVGTAQRDLLRVGLAVVLGAGLPYCMIHYLRKKS